MSATRRFPFAFDPRYMRILRLLGVRPTTSWVELDERELRARFGPWRFRTEVANIDRTCVTGPYGSTFKAIGPHISLADQGLSFGTNTERGVCVLFRTPVASRETFGAVKHPGLTVTVADIEGLVASIGEVSGTAQPGPEGSAQSR